MVYTLKKNNFDLNDTFRFSRPIDFDEERLNALTHEDARQTTRKLAEKMYIIHRRHNQPSLVVNGESAKISILGTASIKLE